MEYSKKIENDFVYFTAIGRFTVQDGDVTRQLIEDIKRSGFHRYVLDLSLLEFIDSSGIGMMLIINAEILAKEKQLSLICADGQVRKVITMTQIDTIIPTFGTYSDYTASMGKP